MTKRIVVVYLVLAMLTIMSLQTVWVGVNLALCSSDVVESGMNADFCSQMRAGADKVYTEVGTERARFYNSRNAYIRWLSTMNNNLIRVPFSIAIIYITYKLWEIVIECHKRKNRKRRRARK